MSRVIKFRAWIDYGNHAEMLPNVQNHINGEWAFGHLLNAGNVSVMQFTGLKDKNGVDIYEQMELDGLYEVEFKGGSYVLINISNGDIMLLCDYINSRGGNVKITREYTKV